MKQLQQNLLHLSRQVLRGMLIIQQCFKRGLRKNQKKRNYKTKGFVKILNQFNMSIYILVQLKIGNHSLHLQHAGSNKNVTIVGNNTSILTIPPNECVFYCSQIHKGGQQENILDPQICKQTKSQLVILIGKKHSRVQLIRYVVLSLSHSVRLINLTY